MQPFNLQNEAIEALEHQAQEERDIPGETSNSSLAVQAPANRRLISVPKYKHELKKRMPLGDDDRYKVKKASANVKVNNYTGSLARAMAEMNQNIILLAQGVHSRLDRIDDKLDRIDDKLDRICGTLDRIEGRPGKIDTLRLFLRVSENYRRRSSGLPQMQIPFVVGKGPQNTDLPLIDTIEDIERLTKPQVKRYLSGYAVDYDANAARKALKALLRDTLDFSTAADRRFNFT